ncbi:UPF0182 family protein [Ornithinibacillus gellani]|uniref:UPF0182 family membrane protein n=1 Tax=Ornithinibacillus gellani TaxID=2293253 RepID=UPI000F4913A0|nr:UPF0182 family protein [Ornithinibacillus gellani]TQS75773.1 UPF0182 family protein [Ornithinibacillus gellani]
MDFRKNIHKDTSNIISPKQFQKLKRLGRRLAIIGGFLLLLLIVGLLSFKWVTEYIWMDTLGFGTIFTTIFSTKILLGAAGFLLFAVTAFFTLYWIRRSYISYFGPRELPPVIYNRKPSNLIMAGTAIIIGLIGSSIVQGVGWEPTLKLLNHASFHKADPYFNMDISFYMFILPFVQFIVYVLLGMAIFYLLLEIGAYSVFNMYRKNRTAQLHLGITLGIIGILLAGIHALAPYETLLTNHVNIFQSSVVHGLSYTDKMINIPKAYILAAAAIIGSLWMIIALVRGKLQMMVVPVIIYFGLIILGQGASVIVQSFIVSPNEFSKESPYLEHNLLFTRTAYQLDTIQEKEHPGNYSLDEAMVERNSLTLGNVRLNDARPLLDIYNQLQTFRTYYQFNDMDIDRYKIDGKYEQVFIGARELSTDDLPAQAKTWVNRTLRYTHGYGVAMSHVNKVTSQGQPEYMMKNIPAEGVLDVKRPQIYFGEEPYPNVIVNSKVDEFDYPSGDKNMSNRFEADGAGIPLKGLNRLLFALDEKSFRILVSDQITKDSQLLATRNIMDRVKRIAPFFDYDSDPYIFVREDGSLAWVIDAFVKAENYPYSEPHKNKENYIRNSVKAVVDAYTGEVHFYIVDKEDPLLQTYQNMFPELLTEDIPEDVQSHFRYPEQLFKIQAGMYGTYHMSNLEIFYNREDFWQFPTEKYFNKDIEMNPYFITMKLPEYDEEEFILMMPYTPRKRQNMISWMGVRNDGEHYGEMFVYRFPKQKNIYGPQQIENRINQDSVISQQLNLWSQGGSEVIRGNLLAIPIEDTVLYVEPVYIESSNETSLPEVKQVIMAYEDHIVMEATFDEALDKILTLIDPAHEGEKPDKSDPDDKEQGNDNESDPIIGAEETLRELADLFDAYRDAMGAGDWQKAGEIMTKIEARLNTVE